MATLLVVYPAYGTVSCGQVARYAFQIPGLRLVLADDSPSTTDLDIFNEVVELPPPERLGEAYAFVRRWCDRHRPDGVFMQSERGLLLGSLLARDYYLRGPSVIAAHLCANKYLQRVAMANAGIGNPAFQLVESAAEVRAFARAHGFPVVLKCVISTMSRLVTSVDGDEQVETAVATMRQGIGVSLDVARLVDFATVSGADLGCDPRRQFLVESFLNGDMVETDGLVVQARPFTFGVTEQVQSVAPPFFIEGYLLPAECTPGGPVEAASDAALRALALTDSGFSIEMRVEDGTVRIVEVNGRLGWDEGFSELFKVRTRHERILQAIQLALGIAPEVVRDETRFCALAFRPCYANAIVEELPAREELLRRERDDLKFGLATNVGARFVAPPNPEAYPHVAWALATDPGSSHAAYQKARAAVDGLQISIRSL